MKEDNIRHRGIISEIDHDTIHVTILAESACASCHAKGYCGVADQKEKVIEVKRNRNSNHQIGDYVSVMMQRSLGLKAVLYGYFLPFIILLLTLIVSLEQTGNEGMSGLIAILVLVPYYITLYFLRDKLKNKFVFKLDNDTQN